MIFVITLGFMPARLLQASFDAFYSTRNKELPIKHYLLDQHYPLNKEQNRIAVREVCAEFGIEVIDAGRNLGLHDGFNWALKHIGATASDIVIAYDGDSKPTQQGWDMALVRAILGDPDGKVVWASLMNPRSERDLIARGFDRKTADGFIELAITRTAVTNSVCAWRVGWLMDVGFLQEPRPFYGHLETAMWSKLKGKQWAFLPGWRESDELRDMHDRQYVLYKWAHSHLLSFDGDFEAWLAAGEPLPSDTEKPAQIP